MWERVVRGVETLQARRTAMTDTRPDPTRPDPSPPGPDAEHGPVFPRARRRLLLFAAGMGAFALSHAAAFFPGLVETVFTGGWARLVAPPLSRLTGAVPFSLVEPLLAGYLIWRAVTAVRGLRDVRRGGRSAVGAMGSGALLVLRDLGVALVLFYLLWGFHYARAPVAERVGLAELEEASTGDLVRLSRELVEVANQAYRELHGSDDAGVPTAWPDDWDVFREPLARGWERAHRELGLGPLATDRFGAPKPLTASPLLARLGISGVYFPFTAEALVNATAPPVYGAGSLAHEQAHQRGITSEGEASFLGFVVAMASEDPLLRYATAARTQSRFLGLLARRDTAAYRRVARERVPGLVRDLRDYAEYRRRWAGPVSEATTRVNDAYLRSQGVPGGTASYGEVTGLLLRYARGRGGTLLPAAPDSAGTPR